ncbi:MAG: transcriptional regulator with XRE-family HTH domain [Motiliproteus sp.]|jgi:transcriptional regulator with XRE-family HTH domain
MNKLSLLSTLDVQVAFSQSIRDKRKALKLSRAALAERSTVPASTIKKFETTGQISLRQLLLLWQCVDDLRRLFAVTTQAPIAAGRAPTSIDEVLAL